MFKKFAISIFALFCLCSSTLFAQKEALENFKDFKADAYAVPPEKYRGNVMDDLLVGEITLKNGLQLRWSLMYDKQANKPMNLLFERPKGVTEEEFNPEIQAMTIIQFWDGVGNCMLNNVNANAAVRCINTLIMTALTDCRRTEKKEDCWMIRTF